MKTISIGAWKGGVGKTTFTFNLAMALNYANKRILLIDIDSQCNLTHNFTESPKNTILSPNMSVLKTSYKNIDLIASDINLINDHGDIDISKYISYLKKDYDYIIIDTPPNINELTQQAFINSDSIVLVSDVSQYSLNGLLNTIEQYDLLCNENKIKNNINGIILNNLNNNNLSKMFVADLEKTPLFENLLMKPYIPRWTAFQKTGILSKSLKELKENKAQGLIEHLILDMTKRGIL